LKDYTIGWDELGGLNVKQAERDDLLIRLDQKMLETCRDIKEIKNTLFGNGREGIVSTITKHRVYFSLMGISIIILAGKLTLF